MNIVQWFNIVKIKNPPILLLSYMIAGIESNYNQYAIGNVGEVGFFQIRPEYYPSLKDDKSVKNQVDCFLDLMNKNVGYLKSKGYQINFQNLVRIWNGGLGGMHLDAVQNYVNKYIKNYWFFN